MAPRKYVHLLLILSEIIIIIVFVLIFVKLKTIDWKLIIWISSKILTVEKLMKENNYDLCPLISLDSGERYHHNYEYLLQHSGKNCETNYKKCGILDTYGNIMCIPK